MTAENRLTHLEATIGTIDKRFDIIDKRFDTIDKKFDETNQDIKNLRDTMENRFTALQASIDSRMNNLNHLFLAGMATAIISLAGIIISDKIFP